MNGPDNYREATLILENGGCDYGCPHSGCAHEMCYLARAQVHATLALTAGVMVRSGLTRADRHEWMKALDPEYAAGQASDPFGPEAHKTHQPGCTCPDCQAEVTP